MRWRSIESLGFQLCYLPPSLPFTNLLHNSYNLLIALWLSCSLLLSQTSTQLLLCLLSLLYSLLHNAVTGNWWRLWLCPWSPCPA
ncbi:hypothetical protein GBAR_LOCUS27732 [Geodia barretti]|uniref:Uncharacterized protein n=1 Tax=Geodia barretti TaxID=519541 RepID=A0AA35TMV3_GEOBA|nr:hypothetical protein GBAR_LOCUS27732 [Geodia barretti]